MKVNFEYENIMKEIYFEKYISFHGNVDNQDILYDVILDGLNGNDKSFMIDNQPVNKKALNVIEFSMNSIFDDLKMTSKSYNLKIIQSAISDNNEDELILEKINELLIDYDEIIQNKYQFLKNEYGNVIKPKLDIKNMKKVILDNFKLVSKGDINISQEIEFQLMVILNYIELNSEQHFYVVIKHFDYCLDLSQMACFLDQMKALKNLTTFIFSKSFELFEYQLGEDDKVYLINESSLTHYKLDQMGYTFENLELLTEEERKKYSYNLYTMERYRNYLNYVSENIKMVNNLIKIV